MQETERALQLDGMLVLGEKARNPFCKMGRVGRISNMERGNLGGIHRMAKSLLVFPHVSALFPLASWTSFWP